MESNQQISLPSSSSSSPPAADKLSFAFNHLQIDANPNSQELISESPETDDDDDEEDGDFTFMCVGDNNNNDSPSTEVSENRQIQTVFPLFDRSLLFDDDGKLRLPIDVPVDKVFVETDGTVQAMEINMKSNSTGFSKLWRFRNEMNRSNSDSRDAFVFLESSNPETKANAVGGGIGKGKAVRKGLNKKKSVASAHEVYLKQKGGQSEEERRRSYLPYRPGLMGFFTNVNGGLSKNVHPF